jgi:hypothetical protein
MLFQSLVGADNIMALLDQAFRRRRQGIITVPKHAIAGAG